MVSLDPPAGPYLAGSVVHVGAQPASGWTFLGWLGDASGTSPAIPVTMSRAKQVTAVFGTTLNTTVTGSGEVTLSPSGGLYPFGAAVLLTAIPQPSNYFASWGNAASGPTNPLTFVITNANPTVSSLFAPLTAGQFSLTVSPQGLGRVRTSPRANHYDSGQQVSLAALPDTGQRFLGWGGDASGTQNPLVLTVTRSQNITARFSYDPQLSLDARLELLLETGARLTLSGELGAVYQVNYSDDLQVWEPLITATNLLGTVQYDDGTTTNRSHRFYWATGR